MKKIILTSALLIVTTLGVSFEKEPPITEKKKVEITAKSKDRVYFWEVTTLDGTANGYTTSRRLAKKSIKKFAKGTIVSSKIIESYEVVSTKK